MEELGSYEALLMGDEPGGRIWWPEGHSHATHASALWEQLPKKDTRVITHRSSVARVLASGG